MSASHTTQTAEEASGYMATLDLSAAKRILMNAVCNWMGENMRELGVDPQRKYNKAQMIRHRRVVFFAARYKFIREDKVWTDYLATPLGQMLEDGRRLEDSAGTNDGDIWSEEARKLLEPKRRFTTTTSILAVLAILLVALGTIWVLNRPSKEGPECMVTRELSLAEEVRMNPYLFSHGIRQNKDWVHEDWPIDDSRNEDWTDPDVTNDQWLIWLWDHWAEPTTTYKEWIAVLARYGVRETFILRQIRRPEGEKDFVIYRRSVDSRHGHRPALTHKTTKKRSRISSRHSPAPSSRITFSFGVGAFNSQHTQHWALAITASSASSTFHSAHCNPQTLHTLHTATLNTLQPSTHCTKPEAPPASSTNKNTPIHSTLSSSISSNTVHSIV